MKRTAGRQFASWLIAVLVLLQGLAPVSGWAEVQMRCAGMPAQSAPCVRVLVAADPMAIRHAEASMRCCCCASRGCKPLPAVPHTRIAVPAGCIVTVSTTPPTPAATRIRTARAIAPANVSLPTITDATAIQAAPAVVFTANRSTSPSSGPPGPVYGLRAPPSL